MAELLSSDRIMNLRDTKLYEIYYQELFWLAHSVLKKSQQVFDQVEDPGEGGLIYTDSDVHSIIASLLSDSANIRKLVLTPGSKLSGENGERFALRKARALELHEFIKPLNIIEILNHKVRNTLEHFDEYLDEANYDASRRAPEGRVAAYNMIMSHWDVVSPRVFPLRLYVSSEKKFYNMKWSVDIGLIHLEAKSIVDNFKTLDRFHSKAPGWMMLTI